MQRACQFSARLRLIGSPSIRAACHATTTPCCNCSACSPSAMNGNTKMSYQTCAEMSESAGFNGESCTKSRSCSCSSCGAEASGGQPSYMEAPATSVLPRLSHFGGIGSRVLVSQGWQGVFSSSALQSTASYSSLSYTRHRKHQRKDQRTHLRGFSTQQDYQSQVGLSLWIKPESK